MFGTVTYFNNTLPASSHPCNDSLIYVKKKKSVFALKDQYYLTPNMNGCPSAVSSKQWSIYSKHFLMVAFVEKSLGTPNL